jgi:hypothetical protein
MLMLFCPSMEEPATGSRVSGATGTDPVLEFRLRLFLTHPLEMAANFQLISDQAFALDWRCRQEACSSLRRQSESPGESMGTGRERDVDLPSRQTHRGGQHDRNGEYDESGALKQMKKQNRTLPAWLVLAGVALTAGLALAYGQTPGTNQAAQCRERINPLSESAWQQCCEGRLASLASIVKKVANRRMLLRVWNGGSSRFLVVAGEAQGQ